MIYNYFMQKIIKIESLLTSNRKIIVIINHIVVIILIVIFTNLIVYKHLSMSN